MWHDFQERYVHSLLSSSEGKAAAVTANSRLEFHRASFNMSSQQVSLSLLSHFECQGSPHEANSSLDSLDLNFKRPTERTRGKQNLTN